LFSNLSQSLNNTLHSSAIKPEDIINLAFPNFFILRLEMPNSLNPASLASAMLAPYMRLLILAQCMALKHIGQGSVVE